MKLFIVNWINFVAVILYNVRLFMFDIIYFIANISNFLVTKVLID